MLLSTRHPLHLGVSDKCPHCLWLCVTSLKILTVNILFWILRQFFWINRMTEETDFRVCMHPPFNHFLSGTCAHVNDMIVAHCYQLKCILYLYFLNFPSRPTPTPQIPLGTPLNSCILSSQAPMGYGNFLLSLTALRNTDSTFCVCSQVDIIYYYEIKTKGFFQGGHRT